MTAERPATLPGEQVREPVPGTAGKAPARPPGESQRLAGPRPQAPARPPATDGVVVVKLGGTTVADQAQVLDEIAEIAAEQPIVVVHGGGRRVSDWLARLGVPTRFEDGLRVTDEAALEITAAVLRGAVSTELVAALRARGADAIGLSGVDGGLLSGTRVAGKGLVARVTGVRRDVLDAVLAVGCLPVVAPLALDEHGEVCNVNADEAAAGLARGIGARLLVLLTDVDGVRGADGSRVGALTAREAERLIERGVVEGGMIPKVRAALAAVDDAEGHDPAGTTGDATRRADIGGPGPAARTVVIANGAAPHALRRALADPAFGTRVVGSAS